MRYKPESSFDENFFRDMSLLELPVQEFLGAPL
jgi:hypothetical protein